MPLTSSSYTLTSLSDAPSYQLQLTMSGLASGTLTLAFYRNGTLYTPSVHILARAWNGATWADSGASGTMAGGTRSYAYSATKAFDIKVYTNSSKTELLTTGFVSYGETGPKGLDGDDGTDGLTANSTYEFALIAEGTAPGAQTLWYAYLPGPWTYGNEYWTRIRYEWSDSTTASPHITTSDPWKDAGANTLLLNSLRFVISSDRASYERNLRSIGSTQILLSADCKGYGSPSFVWTVNGVQHAGTQVALDIPKKTAPDEISVSCVLTYTKAAQVGTLNRTLTLSAIDVTEYTKCYGILPNTNAITDCIEGDCYVRHTGSDYVPQVFTSGSWIPLTTQNATSFPEAMSKCGNVVILNGADIPVTSTALYAYYRNLYAQTANIDFIATQDLQIVDTGRIRSMGKNAIGDGNSGFIINSDGTSEFVGTVIRNADLSETRIGRLDADVLRTVNEVRTGESFTGMLGSTPYWDLGTVMGDLIAQVSANAVTHKGGSFIGTKVEGGAVSETFSNVLHITNTTERDKDRSLLDQPVTTANAGTAFTVAGIPPYTEAPAKLGGTSYLAKITSTGATVPGKKQYSLDGGTSWNDYEAQVLAHAAFRGKTITLRQVPGATLYDPGSCTVGRVSGISTAQGSTPYMATGNARMVVGWQSGLYSFPTGIVGSVSSHELSNAYNSTLGLAYGNGIFLAICSGSVQSRVLSGGADGTSWSETGTAAYDNLFFADGYFHAHRLVGGAGAWDRSADGVSWEAEAFTCAHPFTTYPNDIMNSRIAYGNGVYIQTFHVTLSSAYVYRSTDGQNWTAINVGSACLTGVAYGEGFFLAYEYSTAYYYASGDAGLTWSKRSLGYTPTKMGSAVFSETGANPASTGSTLAKVFYSIDNAGYLSALTLNAASPTSFTAGSLTASYDYSSYDVGVNLLGPEGQKVASHSTAKDYHAGSFTFNGTDLVAALGSFAYKFAGIFKAGVPVAAGTYDMFQAIGIAWSRIYNSTEAPVAYPSVVTWAGTSLTMTGSQGNTSRIRSNDLFSALSITFTVIAEAKGAYTKSIYPQEGASYDIGVSTNPYHNMHATTFHGGLNGNVQGNVTGNVTGNVSGDINAEGTTKKVWGAVWN